MVGSVVALVVGSVVSLMVGSVVALVVGSVVSMVVGSVVAFVVGSVVSLVVGSVVAFVVGSVVSMVVGSVAAVVGTARNSSGSKSKTSASRPLPWSASPVSSMNMETVMPLRFMELLKLYWGITLSRPWADAFRAVKPTMVPTSVTAAETVRQRFFW